MRGAHAVKSLTALCALMLRCPRRRRTHLEKEALVKLHDALWKIIREHGTSVLGEKRLVFLLMDFRAFDEYPAMRRVMLAAAQNGSLQELSRQAPGAGGDSAGYLRSADDFKRSLSSEFQFREDLSSYAADSLSYALGVIREVREPLYHGFDPFDACRGSRGRGAAGNEGSAAGISGGSPAGGGEAGDAAEGRTGGVTCESGAAGADDADWAPALRTAAEQGDAESEYLLGAAYAGGDGVRKDDKEAFGWFMKAALQGHREAQFRLGEMCHFGEGTGRDDAEAVRWWRKAAEQGHPGAECRLGDAYRYGDGVLRDDAEAERWYRSAAGHGSSEAEAILADTHQGSTAASGRGDDAGDESGEESEGLFPGVAFAASGAAILCAILGAVAGAIVVPYSRSFRESIDWAVLGALCGIPLGALPPLCRAFSAWLRRRRRRK